MGQFTFIDGTTVCPKCKSQMKTFRYKKNAVSNVAVKNDWAAMKKITTWNEQTYGYGQGRMCMNCYKKRQVRFWVIIALFFAAMIACMILGAVLDITPLLVTGLGLIVLFFIFAGSKSGKELFDIWKAVSRYSRPAQEFVSRLVSEHNDQFGRNDMVYAEDD